MAIRDNGLENHSLVANPLVQLYAQCGSLTEAQQVFDTLLERDEPAWASLIVGYVRSGKFQHAFELFDQMQAAGVPPGRHIYSALIKACSARKLLDKGRIIHVDLVSEGFETDNMVSNTLVDMYGRCNSVVEARDVFDELMDKNVVTWNALISVYADQGLAKEALLCMQQMQSEGIVPDAVTLLCSLKACVSIGDLQVGQRLHIEVAKKGFEHHLFLGCTLIDMYAKQGLLFDAHEIFNELPSPCVASWSALIAGYVENGQTREALNILAKMQRHGVSPNVVTFIYGLKACSNLQALDKGQELHAEVIVEGLEDHPFVNSSLVDMYARCGAFAEAREVFDELPHQDIVSWTTLISAYADNGHDKQAIICLEAMQKLGISPNVITIVCSLKACGNTGNLSVGKKLHMDIIVEQLEGNPFATNSLIYMYTKCGSLDEAWHIFEEMHSPDIISWNSIISGFAEQGENERALALSKQMQEQGLLPDNTTLVGVLKAVANMEAFEHGRRLHAQVFHSCEDQSIDLIVATALVDMYCKCGSIVYAQQVFNKMETKDYVLWTSLLTGYAQQGYSDLLFQAYDSMKAHGLQPTAVTFLSLLNVCSHAGLINSAYSILEVMCGYGIEPDIKHLNCIVDLLGRSGQFFLAFAVLERLPIKPTYIIWSTILGHCRNHSISELAQYVFECAVSDEEVESAFFVVMSNLSSEFVSEEYEDVLHSCYGTSASSSLL
ncbi:hypothetical protein KP509_1Z131000 [Ceratopteris richardii]|nr:hypothetical protein KP509_1Z131000 [Ceratopteris richardii]